MKSLASFNLLFVSAENSQPYAIGSHFKVENSKTTYFPSAMIRRNFPQSKTFTRLQVNLHRFEVDKGRTLWLRCNPFGELTYTFSRRGTLINSALPTTAQVFLKSILSIQKNSITKIKMSLINI